jgi:hypothetical protein
VIGEIGTDLECRISPTTPTAEPLNFTTADNRSCSAKTSNGFVINPRPERCQVAKDQVFISYSHKDKKWREELETHLKPYLRNGAITSWSDQQIEPGSQWATEIAFALANSEIGVLLVSPDFLNSDFIHDMELGPLLKKAKQGGAKILWIPVRSSAYKQTPLKNYQAIIDPEKPLAAMTKAKRDHAWVEICETIEKKLHRTDESRRAQDFNSIKNQYRFSRKAESEVPVATMTLRGGHIAKLLLTTDSEILDRFITTLADPGKVLYLIHTPSARWRSIDPKLNKPLGFDCSFCGVRVARYSGECQERVLCSCTMLTMSPDLVELIKVVDRSFWDSIISKAQEALHDQGLL